LHHRCVRDASTTWCNIITKHYGVTAFAVLGLGCVPARRVNATLQGKCLDFEPKLVQFSKGALLQQHAAVYWYEFRVGQLFFVTLR
jgi:hypothetical protein